MGLSVINNFFKLDSSVLFSLREEDGLIVGVEISSKLLFLSLVHFDGSDR